MTSGATEFAGTTRNMDSGRQRSPFFACNSLSDAVDFHISISVTPGAHSDGSCPGNGFDQQ
jgi:hypothetical protein